MPSVTYMNQSAPFWDFVASLEQEGMNHPLFSPWAPNQNHSGDQDAGERRGHRGPPPGFGPWGWGFHGFGGREFPHRGPPPPPGPSEHEHDQKHEQKHDETDGEKDNEECKEKDGDDNDNGEGPSGSGSETEGCRRRKGRHGRCGARRGRHGCGPRGEGFHHRHGPPHHGPPHHGPHGHHGRRGGGWGPWARGGSVGGIPFNPLTFAAGLFEPSSNTNNKNEDEDFNPTADVFDTPAAYVIHVSLPGAKKEDVGVDWDAEKSELNIAGVIYRPGDEEFLKTLAMGERQVGPFKRKVRLGTRANPASVDVDGITAKLEDGVLRVEVPKLGEEGFVEVKRVEVE